MMKKHYDVIVLGRSIGALVAAALLARRDFTVLLLGHGAPPPTYAVGEHTLHRRSFTFLAASSPTWKRVIAELAQSQTWKRRTQNAEPMLQAIAPGFRLDIPADDRLFAREVDREFPELHHVVEQLYGRLGQANAAVDEAFDSDAMWPPGTFWERRETAKFAAGLPYVHAEPDADLLAEFPRGHFYRHFVRASVLFGTHLSTMPPTFAVARLHGAWTRGLTRLEAGEADLEAFLAERISSHGGQCHFSERASSLVLRRGVAAGILIEGDEQPTGCEYIVTDLEGEALAGLAQGQGIHKRALREWPRITSTVGRFTVSIIVRKDGLPEALGPESIVFLPESPFPNRARPPSIRMSRFDSAGDTSLLVAELLLPDHGPLRLSDARGFVLRAISRELPFVERHLLIVDSANDGLPVWTFDAGKRTQDIERHTLGLPPVEPMKRQLEVDPPGYLGLSGEPIRGPIERTLLLGRSVMPGLGQEGELLAAWGVARLITRNDRRKAIMRRDMWTKMEIG
ncbi:MAG: phytoene dehydrogenase [Polyangiaceae bacterium]|nr:phytoene dehydrogenase [Polyangiaceae bacterium]